MLGAICALGAQLPALWVQAVALHALHLCVELYLTRLLQWLRPGSHQRLHAGAGHPVRFARQQALRGNPAGGVQHADVVCAPGLAQPWYGVDGAGKARVAHGEVLRANVKRAEHCVHGGRAAPWRISLLEHRDAVASLHQGAGARNASHACANDGEVARAGRRGGGVVASGPLGGAGNGFAHGLPFRDFQRQRK